MDVNETNLNDVDFDTEEIVDEGILNQEIDNQVNQEIQVPEFTSPEGISPEDNSSESNGKQADVLMDFLKFNGINDPEHIKFEDDDGIVKDRAWNELSYEEKMNILKTSYEQPEKDLDDSEIALINDIRRNKLSPEQYINTIRQQAARDYSEQANANSPQLYSIDDLSDDEIYILDLQDKIPDATDEEILEALSKAKEDKLFDKRVEGIRSDLKSREEAYNQQIALEQEEIANLNFENFKNSILNSIQSFDKVGDLDINLDVDDMEDIAQFILDRDDTGMSYMGKLLNDPSSLVEMAWWALKGRDAINSISEYYNNEIKNVRQSSYLKGLEEGRKNSSKVVYKPQVLNINANSSMGIDDIYG